MSAVVRLADLVQDAPSWSVEARRTVLERLDHAVDGLAAVRAAVLVAERESGTWQGSGDRSFEAWRARTGRAGERSAAAQVRQAVQLAGVPTATAAVAQGQISLEHAAVIAKIASEGTPAQQAAASCPAGQEQLLALAQDLDAGTFAVSVARWASAIDPEALEADHQAQRRERFLQLADTPRGTFVKGRLDTMAGHRLRSALEALSPRPAVDDDRDPGQRSADALDAMASRILALADTKPGGHVPPQISMLASEETWVAARAQRDRRRGASATAGTVVAGGTVPQRGGAGDRASLVTGSDMADGEATTAGGPRTDSPDAYPPATLEDGTPVPVSALAAAMCDCEITRIVIDADGVPLDLGRTQRLFTREQRRAVIARDRECIWPGCHAHARWCEVHHIDWWERDAGPTSIDNGALLCSFHHHETHRRDLSITRVPPERTASSSPGERSAPSAGAPACPSGGRPAPSAGAPPSRPTSGRRRQARADGRRRQARADAPATYEFGPVASSARPHGRRRSGRTQAPGRPLPRRLGGKQVRVAVESPTSSTSDGRPIRSPVFGCRRSCCRAHRCVTPVAKRSGDG